MRCLSCSEWATLLSVNIHSKTLLKKTRSAAHLYGVYERPVNNVVTARELLNMEGVRPEKALAGAPCSCKSTTD